MSKLFATQEVAEETVRARIAEGRYVVQEDGATWLHLNPEGVQDQFSIYGRAVEEVIALEARLEAQARGHEWAWECEGGVIIIRPDQREEVWESLCKIAHEQCAA